MNGPGPLPLKPLFLEKIWAAPRLAEPWGSLWPAPAGVGEVWLASARHHITRVAEGDFMGLGLDEVVERWPGWVLGEAAGSGFPILLKILSVGDWLSVQVHPDDEDAARLEGEPWGKNEAWLVLEALPGAEIVMGLKPGADRPAVERALAENRLAEVLGRVPARPGDVFHLGAGTVHATGPGLTIFEIQQASDVTYRFYDWDRPGQDGLPRPLHQKKALEVMDLGGPGRPSSPEILACQPNRMELLVRDPHFALIRASVKRPHALQWGGRRPRVVFVVEGRGRLASGAREFAPLDIAAGQTWLVPAGLAGVEVFPTQPGLSLLECVG